MQENQENMTENPVGSDRARHLLAGCKECRPCVGVDCRLCGGTGWIGKAWGRTRMAAIKRGMEDESGKKIGRLFFLSDVRKFIRTNSNFKISDVYRRKKTGKNVI
jgi:hypothetical protein